MGILDLSHRSIWLLGNMTFNRSSLCECVMFSRLILVCVYSSLVLTCVIISSMAEFLTAIMLTFYRPTLLSTVNLSDLIFERFTAANEIESEAARRLFNRMKTATVYSGSLFQACQ